MGWKVIKPVKIGDEVRNSGYVLTDEDMRGRNVSLMERHKHIAYVDDERSGERPRRRRTPDGE